MHSAFHTEGAAPPFGLLQLPDALFQHHILSMVGLLDPPHLLRVCHRLSDLTARWASSFSALCCNSISNELNIALRYIIPRSSATLRAVSFTNMSILDRDVPQLVSSLSRCSALTSLEIRENRGLTSQGMLALAPLFEHLPELQALCLEEEVCSVQALAVLSPVMQKYCPKLRELSAAFKLRGAEAGASEADEERAGARVADDLTRMPQLVKLKNRCAVWSSRNAAKLWSNVWSGLRNMEEIDSAIITCKSCWICVLLSLSVLPLSTRV